MTDVEPGIAALIEHLEKAWNAGDGTAFAQAFWEDADFTVFDGWWFAGRDAIAKDHVWAFTEGPRRGSTAQMSISSLRGLGDDVAVAHLVAVIDGRGPDGQPARIVAVPRAVFQRRGGEWGIATFVNLVHQPVPPAHHPDNRSVRQPVPGAEPSA